MQGKIHVDLLKIQHHGSKHSTDARFFRSVTADRYVISGNGKHGIPHREMLTWLSSRAGMTSIYADGFSARFIIETWPS